LTARNCSCTALTNCSVEHKATRTAVASGRVAEQTFWVYRSAAYASVSGRVDEVSDVAAETVTSSVVAGSAIGIAKSAGVSAEEVSVVAAETCRGKGRARFTLWTTEQTLG